MTPLAHTQLSPVDAAWLRMDSPTNRMVLTGALSTAGRIDYDELVAWVEAQLRRHERFGLRVVEPRTPAAPPQWEPDRHFDVRAHVHHLRLKEPGGERELMDLVSDLMSARLDPTRPLWQLYLVDGVSGGTALVGRLHHCLADDYAWMRLFGDGGGELPAAVARPEPSDRARRVRSERPAPLAARAASYAANVGRLLLLPGDPCTPLRGRLSVRKRAVRVAPLPCAALKAAAHARGGTLHDVLGACVAGALREVLARAGADVRGLELRALLPRVLYGDVASGGGHHLGLVLLPLPVGLADAEARFVAVKRSMDAIKSDHDASIAFAVLDAMGVASEQIEHLGLEVFSRKASLLTSNVAGPSETLHLAGQPVADISVWSPVSGSMGLGITAVSYAGRLRITLHIDASLPIDAEGLALALSDEAARYA